MGLHGDLFEVKSVWRNASTKLRIWLALSTFFASVSIASLSESIIKWRGFISDGISLYRELITENLHFTAISMFNINFDKFGIDSMIILLLIAAAIIRTDLSLIKSKNKATLKSQRKNSIIYNFTAVFIGIILVIIFVLIVVFFPGSYVSSMIWEISQPWFTIPSIVLFITFYATRIYNSKERAVFITNLLAPLICVLFLAAINKGIMAPLS